MPLSPPSLREIWQVRRNDVEDAIAFVLARRAAGRLRASDLTMLLNLQDDPTELERRFAELPPPSPEELALMLFVRHCGTPSEVLPMDQPSDRSGTPRAPRITELKRNDVEGAVACYLGLWKAGVLRPEDVSMLLRLQDDYTELLARLGELDPAADDEPKPR